MGSVTISPSKTCHILIGMVLNPEVSSVASEVELGRLGEGIIDEADVARKVTSGSIDDGAG